MDRNDRLSAALDADIAFAHERLIRAVEGRLPTLSLETKERYFALLSTLVAKLETPGKSLREIVNETLAEGMAHLLAELGPPR